MFDINLGLSIWTIAVFVLLLFILKKFAWGPILGAVQDREDRLRSTLESAASEREESTKLLEQYRKQMLEARREAQDLIVKAKEAGAEIYQGNTYEILQEIHSQNHISKITTKATFRPVYQELFQKLGDAYDVEQLPDYFLLQDNYLHPAKRFFQYWNKIKKNLKY